MIQPLFPHDDEADQPTAQEEFLIPSRHNTTIQPIHGGLPRSTPAPANRPFPTEPTSQATSAAAAVELIRHKVQNLYQQEPSAKQEIAEVTQPHMQLSKHQKFMHDLSTSGKPLAQIHGEWHNYYVSLPDNEKHEVWQEFYANSQRQPSVYLQRTQPTTMPTGFGPTAAPATPIVGGQQLPILPYSDRRSATTIRKQIRHQIATRAAAPAKLKQHFQSLAFGLGTGLLVLFVFLFGFFNEVIVTPFIQPSRHVSATPIIISDDSLAASATPEVIIPKINVQIPVIYDTGSTNEAVIQDSLQNGVVHYATTSTPGQQGNTAIFGHSSNNIFNKGKYKFAFVLLHTLEPGDIFYLTYNQKVYTYKVFDRKVVAPNEVSVLNPVAGKTATATLITCDPPGTSNNRLVIWGEQISPDPVSAAQAAPVTTATTGPAELPSNGPSLWSRIIHWDF